MTLPLVRWVALLVALFVVQIVGGSAVAAPAPGAGLQIDGQRVGFDNYYKVGYWMPVAVTLANPGDSVVGTVSVTESSLAGDSYAFAADANMPSQSRKIYQLPIPAYRDIRQLNVAFAAKGYAVKQLLNPTPISSDDYLYAVVSPLATALNGERDVVQFGHSVTVAHLLLSDLPTTGPTLGAIDAIVLDSVDTTKLTQGQMQTLGLWVRGGGQLIITGGAGAAQTLVGLGDLASVAIGTPAVAQTDVSVALSQWGGLSDAHEQPVAQVTPLRGSIVRLANGQTPLVVDRPVGAGWVTFVALDLGSSDIENGPPAQAFWQHVLTGGHASPVAFDRPNSVESYFALPAVASALPAPGVLAGVFGGYLLLLGPVSYVVLLERKRRELLWITIPAISLLFTLGFIGYGLGVMGRTASVGAQTVIRQEDGTNVSLVQTVTAVASPTTAAALIHVDGLGSMWPFRQSTPKTFPPVTVSPGSVTAHVVLPASLVTYFQGEGVLVAPPVISAQLVIDGSSVRGTIENVSNGELTRVRVAVGEVVSEIPRLAPGQQTQISLPIFTPQSVKAVPTSPYTTTLRPVDRLIADATGGRSFQTTDYGSNAFAFPHDSYGIVVTALSSKSPLTFTVQDRALSIQETTLYVEQIPVRPATGNYQVLPGFAKRQVLQNVGGSTSTIANGLNLGSTVVLQFALPPSMIGARWTDLLVETTGSAGTAPTAAVAGVGYALYNWDTNQWDTQTPRPQDGNIDVPNPVQYVDQRGLVRVRLTGINGRPVVRNVEVRATGQAQ